MSGPGAGTRWHVADFVVGLVWRAHADASDRGLCPRRIRRVVVELVTDARLLGLARREDDLVFRIRAFDEPDVVQRKLMQMNYALYSAPGVAPPRARRWRGSCPADAGYRPGRPARRGLDAQAPARGQGGVRQQQPRGAGKDMRGRRRAGGIACLLAERASAACRPSTWASRRRGAMCGSAITATCAGSDGCVPSSVATIEARLAAAVSAARAQLPSPISTTSLPPLAVPFSMAWCRFDRVAEDGTGAGRAAR
ncbi:hypothetical protein ACU4GD_03790 [Cupriavidus basilensis]